MNTTVIRHVLAESQVVPRQSARSCRVQRMILGMGFLT